MYIILFQFTGFILISIGSMVNNINTDYAQFIEARFFSPSISIVGIGCLVFVIALFGCYGAYKLSVAAITMVSVEHTRTKLCHRKPHG